MRLKPLEKKRLTADERRRLGRADLTLLARYGYDLPMPSDYVKPRRACAQLADLPASLHPIARRLGETRRRAWELQVLLKANRHNPPMECALRVDEDRLQSIHPWFAESPFLSPVYLRWAISSEYEAFLMPADARTRLPGRVPMQPDEHMSGAEIRELERTRAMDETLEGLQADLANNSAWIARGLWDIPPEFTAPLVEEHVIGDLQAQLDAVEGQERTLALTLLVRLCEELLGEANDQITVTAVWGIARVWTAGIEIDVAQPEDETPLSPRARAIQGLIAELQLHCPLAAWDTVSITGDGVVVDTRSGVEPDWMGTPLSEFAPELI